MAESTFCSILLQNSKVTLAAFVHGLMAFLGGGIFVFWNKKLTPLTFTLLISCLTTPLSCATVYSQWRTASGGQPVQFYSWKSWENYGHHIFTVSYFHGTFKQADIFTHLNLNGLTGLGLIMYSVVLQHSQIHTDLLDGTCEDLSFLELVSDCDRARSGPELAQM